MWSDQQLVRAMRVAGRDIVRDLRRRSLYRIVDEDGVLGNLFRRLEQNARLEQLYREGKPFTQEIIRQAHFAFFEQVHALLKSGPRQEQTFEELARYFYQRAMGCLYESVLQQAGSDQAPEQLEFKQVAFESSQAAIAHVYARIAWTGGIAQPSRFYTYANCTLRRQCAVTLSQKMASQATSVVQLSQQKCCLTALVDTIRALVDQNQRAIATLCLAGFERRKIALLLNLSEQDVAAGISKLLEAWGNDRVLRDRFEECLARG